MNPPVTLRERLVGAINPALPTTTPIANGLPRDSTLAASPPPAVRPAVLQDLQALLQRLESGPIGADPRAEIQRFIEALPNHYLREVISEFPGDKIRQTLLVLFDDSENDVDKFKQNIEIWFNNAMDRVGGWYKRKTQTVITVLSVLATVGLNVDALLIIKHLQTNPGVRTALVAQAKTYAESAASAAHTTPSVATGVSGAASGPSPSQLSAQASATQTRLEQLSLPIGWVSPIPLATVAAETEAKAASATASAAKAALATAEAASSASSAEMQARVKTTSAAASAAASAAEAAAEAAVVQSVRKPSDAEIDSRLVLPTKWNDWDWYLNTIRFHFLGWLLTALAATLGAPFWFDTLNRIISIRSAGKAPEEKPKPPRDVPKPLEPGQLPKKS